MVTTPLILRGHVPIDFDRRGCLSYGHAVPRGSGSGAQGGVNTGYGSSFFCFLETAGGSSGANRRSNYEDP
jgi:hypothetical protein